MKKRIAVLNSYNIGSTGKIACDVAALAEKRGYEVMTCFPATSMNKQKKKEGQFLFGHSLLYKVNVYLTMLTGLYGCFQIANTRKLIAGLKRFQPELIHLHNLHSSYVNLSMLFSYIKKNNIKVVWTTHDCWLFTGHCAHFDYIGCNKWKEGCQKCPQYRQYPKAYVDTSKFLWKKKKEWFQGVETVVLATPSQWLRDLAKESFLQEYSAQVIHNGIDLDIFQPAESNFREKYGIPADKCILLGVAFNWGQRKGLDVFVELANKLDKEKYQIVLVGTNDAVDKQLPPHIISIHRTQNQRELAEIYTAADLFVNPTREETYPTVNMEAIACGTPVLTFRTGGSPEIPDKNSGAVVGRDDVEAMEREILRISSEQPFSKEACLNRAQTFDKNDKLAQYVDLYDSLLCASEEE